MGGPGGLGKYSCRTSRCTEALLHGLVVSASDVPTNSTQPTLNPMAQFTTTVILATFNRAHFLGESLDSILSQTHLPDQVIVVNDGSTDNTDAVVASYGARIEYIKKENGGRSSAINAALPRVRSDLVWAFDDDDVAIEDALERHVDALARDQDAGFSYGGYIWMREGADGVRRFGPEIPRPQAPRDELFLALLEALCVNWQGMVVRMHCFDRIGPCDLRYSRAQDYEILLRLARQFDGVPVEGPTFFRRDHPGVRGPESDRHTAASSESHWFAFERMLFREVRQTLDLAEYLPRQRRDRPLPQAEQRRALLQRACAMARRALWSEMFDDLEAALARDSGPLSAAEQRICAAAFGAPYAMRLLDDASGLLARLARVCRTDTGQEIRFHLARGLYYCARAEARNGETLQAVRLLADTATLIGLLGLARLTAYKFRIGR